MPFQFTNHLLREGMRAAVSCTVLEGDRPIDLIWEFEGKPISAATTQVTNDDNINENDKHCLFDSNNDTSTGSLMKSWPHECLATLDYVV